MCAYISNTHPEPDHSHPEEVSSKQVMDYMPSELRDYDDYEGAAVPAFIGQETKAAADAAAKTI